MPESYMYFFIIGNGLNIFIIVTDSAGQERELPLNYEREITQFSREERLAIHRYVVEKGKEKRKNQIEVKDIMIDWDAEDAKNKGDILLPL